MPQLGNSTALADDAAQAQSKIEARLSSIATRRLAQEALLKTSTLQTAILNSAHFSSIATDLQGVIQIFNVGAERMLGYAAADVMNKATPADLFDRQELIARAEAISREFGTPMTPGFEALMFKASRSIADICELTYIRRDGSRLPAVVSVTALRDPQDAIIGFLLSSIDNTERKRIDAEQQHLLELQEETNKQLPLANLNLREHEEDVTREYATQPALLDSALLVRTILDTVVDGIVTIHACGGIIETVNPAMARLFGYTAAELTGQNFSMLIPELVGERCNMCLAQRDANFMWRTFGIGQEVVGRRKDGSMFPVEMTVNVMQQGSQRYFTGILRDISARKQVEADRMLLDQALQDKHVELTNAKTAAEKANLAKSDFLSGMSHELRSPLNAILGFAQLMASGSPPPTPSQTASIAQILRAGWYLLKLINEILDLALIESGKLSLSLEPISLPEILHDCQALIEPQAQKSGIRMNFPQFDGPCFVNADGTRLKQVLINLLSNAIKYNRVGGTVDIRCSTTATQRVHISVQDTGDGLSPKKITQLFQPFNRLGQETGPEEGTGIGLVVSKRLVELMGGEIGAQSTIGVGSSFWFELPLAVAPQVTAGSDEPIARLQSHIQDSAAQRTLLYVEDNQANTELVEQLIARRPDMRLLSAGDGARGIALARSHQPQIILMDIHLPDISGIQALKILREDPVTARIPVLALSANAMPRDIEKALVAGFFRYLTKPIKLNEFMEALDMALEFSEMESARANKEKKL